MQWSKPPKVEYISSECYNNYDIFKMEQEEIFSKVWVLMCHISEMRNKGDYRTTRIADKRVIAINVDGENVQAYYNTNDIDYRKVAGTITYDGWATTEKPLHCEVKHGGMVWVTLDPIQIWMLNSGLLVHLIVSQTQSTQKKWKSFTIIRQ